MATPRTHVPNDIRRTLIEQAGRKCANPGCPVTLLELHHIKEWHIYQTHDAQHMIAICATCHDSVDRGLLQISDETLYRWKGIDRPDSVKTAHIYVEPGPAPKLLLGSIAVRGDSGVVLFDMSEAHRLSFAIREGEILLLNLKISDPEGRLLLDVVDGHVRKHDTAIEFQTRQGAIQVPGGFDSPFIPEWVRERLLREDQSYTDAALPLLSIEVIDRGIVRVEGLWIEANRAVVITPDRLSFVSPGLANPLTIIGEGEETILSWEGPISTAMFKLGS